MDSITIQQWLISLNLGHYAREFENGGYTTIAKCRSLNEEKLLSIGIEMQGHIRRILSHVSQLEDINLMSSGSNKPTNEVLNAYQKEDLEFDSQPPLPAKTKQYNLIDFNQSFGVENLMFTKPDVKPKPVPLPRKKPIPKPRPSQRHKIIGVTTTSTTDGDGSDSPRNDSDSPRYSPRTERGIPANTSLEDVSNGSRGIVSSPKHLKKSPTVSPRPPKTPLKNEKIDEDKFNKWPAVNALVDVKTLDADQGSVGDVSKPKLDFDDRSKNVQEPRALTPDTIKDLEDYLGLRRTDSTSVEGRESVTSLPPPMFPPPPLPKDFNSVRDVVPPLPKKIEYSTSSNSTVETPTSNIFDSDDPFSEFGQECAVFNNNTDAFSGHGAIGGSQAGHNHTFDFDEGAIYANQGNFATNVLDDFDPFRLNGAKNKDWTQAAARPKTTDIITMVPPAPHPSDHAGSFYEILDRAHQDTDENWSSGDELSGSPCDEVMDTYMPDHARHYIASLTREMRISLQAGRTQVSKRIIPLSAMKLITSAVTPNDTDRFKFKLSTKNRVFYFAAESLGEHTLWCSTLMGAILHYKPPECGEKEGGSMHNPDISGLMRFDRQKDKTFVAMKGTKLCYYLNKDDYLEDSPIHEIDMKLVSVKDIGRQKLQLSIHYRHYILSFDSVEEVPPWKFAMEEAIADGLADDTVLHQVLENPSNNKCADCGIEKPHWASLNLCVVLCKKCAGVHRSFGVHISRVRSLRLDTKIWTPGRIEMMQSIGNKIANDFWEFDMPVHPGDRISYGSTDELRKKHLERKYINKAYVKYHALKDTGYANDLGEALVRSAETDNIAETYSLIFSGANVLYESTTIKKTAIEVSKLAGQRLQTELLYQNGGDKSSQARIDSDEAMATRLREEISHQGILFKTGSNTTREIMSIIYKDRELLQRYCVLAHGILNYYVDDTANAARGSIECASMMMLQTCGVDRYEAAFEISTSKNNNRIYLFATQSVTQLGQWMRQLTKTFCPISLIDEVGVMDFTLAGHCYIKVGVAGEWEKNWIMLHEKMLSWKNKDGKLEGYDVRKILQVSLKELGSCPMTVEPGKHVVVDLPGKALYIQTELKRDTERVLRGIQTACRSTTNSIEDQQLTPLDVPVSVEVCLKFIETHGLDEQGIYRKNGSTLKCRKLLEELQADPRSVRIKEENYDVHDVCSTLRKYLQSLSDSILTKRGYTQWLTHSKIQDRNTMVQWYKYQLQCLPFVNRQTLKRIIIHLSRVTAKEDHNKMGVLNLAKIFGKALMTLDDHELNPLASVKEIGSEIKVIYDLILERDWLFDIDPQEKETEDKIQAAMEKIEKLRVPTAQSVCNILKVNIYMFVPSGHCVQEDTTADTTVQDLVHRLQKHVNDRTITCALFEMVKVSGGYIERPLDSREKVFSVVDEWKHWSDELCRNVCLCFKVSEIADAIEQAFNPSKPLMCEMKYADNKKKPFKKCFFQFSQSKLTFRKDIQATSYEGSWNIEELTLYLGADNKRSPPTRWCFTFLVKGEKPTQYFGRCVACPNEDEMLHWLAGMRHAQFS